LLGEEYTMKKEIWVDCRAKPLEELARAYGATGVLGKNFSGLCSRSEEPVHLIRSEADIERLPRDREYVFVQLSDWKVIPAENLIALLPKTKIIVKTNNIQEARTLSTTLEKGVYGFLVDEENSLKEICSIYKPNPKLELVDAKVTNVRAIDLGKRVCLDGIMTYGPREGILAGFLSGFMFLTDGETNENPYIPPRAWRVNAGAASLYCMCKREGKITPRYLDDISSGDELLVADSNGDSRIEIVGRVKKEWRPMTFIQAEYNGRKGSMCSQTAETVRLVTAEGTKPITEICVGDRLKAYVTNPMPTHSGRLVEERIVEI
jgi:3-dehydroquinate synthase II